VSHSWHKSCCIPTFRRRALRKNKMQCVIYLIDCFEFPSVLKCSWLSDPRGIQSLKLALFILKGSLDRPVPVYSNSETVGWIKKQSSICTTECHYRGCMCFLILVCTFIAYCYQFLFLVFIVKILRCGEISKVSVTSIRLQ